jgi:hypothetical protein
MKSPTKKIIDGYLLIGTVKDLDIRVKIINCCLNINDFSVWRKEEKLSEGNESFPVAVVDACRILGIVSLIMYD